MRRNLSLRTPPFSSCPESGAHGAAMCPARHAGPTFAPHERRTRSVGRMSSWCLEAELAKGKDVSGAVSECDAETILEPLAPFTARCRTIDTLSRYSDHCEHSADTEDSSGGTDGKRAAKPDLIQSISRALSPSAKHRTPTAKRRSRSLVASMAPSRSFARVAKVQIGTERQTGR